MLHDNVVRKFVDVIELSDWEVESEEGWVDISSVNKTISYEIYEVVLEDGRVLKCADTHIFIDADDNEVFAEHSMGKELKTNQGNKKVVSVTSSGEFENMYDLTVNSEKHLYYGDGVLSHNSTTTAACVLHYLLFQEYKTVAILANKAATAREILGRIQKMYEFLPLWMQVGITSWNKGSFSLGNGCKVVAASTSSSAIRGESISWLVLDEFAFVPPNQATEFFESVYPTISSGQESKISVFSTPKGMNHFYKMWVEASEGRSEFKHFEIQWNEVPGRDQAWKEKTIANIGQESWDQEFEACLSGDSEIEVMNERGKVYKTSLKNLFYINKDNTFQETNDGISTIRLFDRLD